MIRALVEESLEKHMKEIEVELNDFVKLQNWENRGYFSMQTNVERAQRKLHKLLREAEIGEMHIRG